MLDDLPPLQWRFVWDFLGGQIRYVTSAPDPGGDGSGNVCHIVFFTAAEFRQSQPPCDWQRANDGERFTCYGKGILFNSSPAYGNELVRIKLPASLADPDACEMIAEEARQRLAGG